ncbi:MAG: RHS repeat-associated core domain-containing protein [Polyangiaceae bacterium]
MKTHAGAPVDDQRPRLDGGGLADAAVPATAGGQPITLDAAGRLTALRGVSLGYSGMGYLIEAAPPIPGVSQHFLMDASMRRVLKASADGAEVERYAYEGANRVAVLDRFGTVTESTLFDGVDHPIRLKRGGTTVFLELDLAGHVRRLRAPGGGDLGGYRYSAFGKQLEDTASASFTQPYRWKGRPRDVLGGVETYDMRARVWLPEVGVFSAIDELAYHDARSTLWGWPGQSPVRWSDPYGRGVTPRGPDFLGLLGDAAFQNAADLRDFAVADYNAGNYTSAYFHGGLAFDMALIGVAAKALPAIVDAVAMTEGGGRSCKTGARGSSGRGQATATGGGETKQTGSYTNTHASGKTYSGKGSRTRSQQSGRRQARANDDPHTATDWTPAENTREAFKQESRRLDGQGGVESPSNYNEVESPGKRFRIEDGEL